jgi:pimeloyl-ACP methyl ester carboxylesterase
VFGAEDKVVPPGNADLIAAKIEGAQVKLLPGIGHHFPIEDGELTVKVILEFLKGA